MRYPGHFAALAVASLLLSGCFKPAPDPQAPTPEPAESRATPSPATPTPAPIAVATPPPAPQKRLAPEGVFYLLRGKSVETADGIVGIKPGMKVVLQKDGTYLADGQKLTLQASEITNDLDLAAQAGNAELRSQMAIRMAAQATPVPPAASPDASASTSSARPAPAAAPRTAVSATGRDYIPGANGGSTGLNSGTSLGAGHTMTKDGWLWQKDEGGRWVRVKPLR